MTSPGPPSAIRRLTFADLARVVAIERQAFSAPWSLAMFLAELSKPGGICLAADEDGEVVGYLICSRFEEVWHVMNVAVAAHRRRCGIGRSLLETLLAEIGDAHALTLEVRVSNAGARDLYESLGFLAAGLRRRYYADNGEDALIMWRTPGTLRGTLEDIPAADPRWAGVRPA